MKKEYDDVVSSLKKARAEQDYNQSLFEQLDAAKLQDGELESLEAEQKQLANAEEIKGTLVQVENLFPLRMRMIRTLLWIRCLRSRPEHWKRYRLIFRP